MILNAWRMATALRREWRRLLPTHAHRTCPLFSLEHAYGCCPHTPTAHAHCSPSNMPTVAAHTSPILFPAHTGSYPGTMAHLFFAHAHRCSVCSRVSFASGFQSFPLRFPFLSFSIFRTRRYFPRALVSILCAWPDIGLRIGTRFCAIDSNSPHIPDVLLTGFTLFALIFS